MTGKEFSQRPFTFPRGTKVRIRYTSIGKNHRDDIKETVCCFYGIKPIFNPCSANADDFAPVFRAVAKNGRMSNKRPEFDGIHCQLFSTIVSIDYADSEERLRVWTERWGKDHILVCKECGNLNIECKCWIDANLDQTTSETSYDTDDNWCRDCEQHAHFCFLSEFEEKMNDWFAQADFKTMESMFGLHHEDFDEEDGYQAFVYACEARWNALSYEQKRKFYNEGR